MGPEVKGSVLGVKFFPLKQIGDDRGRVVHMMKSSDPFFTQFGEIYFSFTKCGVVKAWKRHKEMTQHFAVPVGELEIVIYDGRSSSATYKNIMKITTGETRYGLIKIPPLVWYGFKGLSSQDAMIANCTDRPFSEGEVERLDLQSPEIPYQW